MHILQCSYGTDQDFSQLFGYCKYAHNHSALNFPQACALDCSGHRCLFKAFSSLSVHHLFPADLQPGKVAQPGYFLSPPSWPENESPHQQVKHQKIPKPHGHKIHRQFVPAARQNSAVHVHVVRFHNRARARKLVGDKNTVPLHKEKLYKFS